MNEFSEVLFCEIPKVEEKEIESAKAEGRKMDLILGDFIFQTKKDREKLPVLSINLARQSGGISVEPRDSSV